MSTFSMPAGVRVIPVLVISDPTQAAPTATALAAGGLPVLEVTWRTAAAPAALAAMAALEGVIVGAGTVLNPAQVDEAADAGASFIVSPGLLEPVVTRSRQRGLPVLPGVATATDIMTALDLGLDTVKFFPAGVNGGPDAIKALAAPFGGVRFVPTGGVTPDNLDHYLALDAVLAVGGSWMAEAALINEGRFDEITERAAAAVARTSS